MTQVKKAESFAALHKKGNPLQLYNIWDAASAKAVESAGASAIATGSWGVAAAQGYADGQAIPLETVLQVVARIVGQTDLPVTMDFEAGYADDLETLSDSFRRVIATGIVGINFEDQMIGSVGLQSITAQQARIAQLRDTADRVEVPVFINARTDMFLKADAALHASLLEEVIARGRAYLGAGASGFFVPGVTQENLISSICEAVPGPVNVMAMSSDADPKVFRRLGTSRISYGPFPMRDLFATLQLRAERLYRV